MRPKLITMAALLLALALLAPAGPACAMDGKKMEAETRGVLLKPHLGDLNSLIKHRVIRVLVAYSKTNYFLDGATKRGMTYEAFIRFEKWFNQRLWKKKQRKKHLGVHMMFLPVSRDQLLPYLIQGKGDIAAASLTVTKQRLKEVDFINPLYGKAKELVVTSKSAPAIKSLDDLSGKTVCVRESSAYFQSLNKLNAKFKKAGKAPVKIELANENLETEDILEMVNADLIQITVADNYLADFWAKLFKNMKVHQKVFLRNNAKIAWAIRKNCPQLKKELNLFVKKVKVGTLLGNIVMKRYLEDTRWAKNALNPKAISRFNQTIKFFKKYSSEYGFDYLMITALAYQESGLDQKKRSPAGAVGIMQMLPSTAKGNSVNIPDIHKIDRNVHAGTKYLRYIYNRYFKDAKMSEVNRMLFTFASYNAGPARVRSLRARAKKMGLNPNIWFRNVEVAAARYIGRETVQYVGNIFKYYLAYQSIAKKDEQRDAAMDKIKKK